MIEIVNDGTGSTTDRPPLSHNQDPSRNPGTTDTVNGHTTVITVTSEATGTTGSGTGSSTGDTTATTTDTIGTTPLAGIDPMLHLPIGTRIRWNTDGTGKTQATTTRFGRVTRTQGATLIVREENTTTEWGLVPGTDHFAVLGRAS